jgi:hypothetical protein
MTRLTIHVSAGIIMGKPGSAAMLPIEPKEPDP